MYVYLCIHTYKYINIIIYGCVYKYICLLCCTHPYTNTYTYIYIYIHIGGIGAHRCSTFAASKHSQDSAPEAGMPTNIAVLRWIMGWLKFVGS